MKEKISRKTFVRLGALLGVGAAGASVLAACGGNSGGESGSGGSNDGSGGGSGYGGDFGNGGSSGSSGEKTDRRTEKQVSGGQGDGSGGGGSARTSGKKTGGRAEKQEASDRQAIARTSEVRPGAALEFEDSGGNPAVLVRLRSGNFVAYSALCTHEGCAVAYSNGQLACPCHGSIFDPANNARVVNGPAQRPLPKIPIEVRGGDVVGA